MSKKLSLVLYLILAIISVSLFVLTVLASAGSGVIWQSTFVPIILSLFALSLIVAIVMYNPKKSIYSVGFYLSHAGIVFFLAGCLTYSLFGHSVNVAPPNVSSLTPTVQAAMYANGEEIPNGYYNRIPGKNGKVLDLGFNFRVTDFKTEYYDEEKTSVKHYEATLGILDGENEISKSLTVNHPIYYNGWKIYLMSVSENTAYGYEEILLTFKRDQGEILSTSGIIMTVLGVFAMSFLRKKEDGQ